MNWQHSTDDPFQCFWNTTYQIPGTTWTLKGYSRAAFRTGFYIPDIGLMLDAGPQLRNKPDHIFITHTHGDHIASLPFTMIGDEKGDHIFHIYAPKQSEEWLRQYITALFNVNSMRFMRSETERWYEFHPMTSGTEFPLTIRKNPYLIEVFKCNHSIPTVSYGIKVIKHKLKEEYLGLPGKEIAILRKEGKKITNEVINPVLAYVCDTTIKVFALNPTILNYKTVIIECTFLKDEDSNGSDHIAWNELKPFVVGNPHVNFILIHFSMKYKESEIRDFFLSEEVTNVRPWIAENKLLFG
jgi:ribonuclease Z